MKQLNDILSGKIENRIFPFFWQHGDHRDMLTEQIKSIKQSGCDGFCVEARPHNDFGGDGWWADMDIILSTAEKMGMKVWLLDDDHFPTGHANGEINRNHPELRAHQIIEGHIDMVGPAKESAALIRNYSESDRIIGAYLIKKADEGETLSDKIIDVSNNIKGRWIYCDVPEGFWRLFYIIDTQRYADDRIDMIQPESVKVLIDTVYEPHFEHYSKYFGNTFLGFFSDEPKFGNGRFSDSSLSDLYGSKIGLAGLCLPFSDEVLERMKSTLGFDAKPYLPALWYNMPQLSPQIRLAYMDAITSLYSEAFTGQLGKWCEKHGVEYIGHIIEDRNASGHMGCSAGHYFRALHGQHMSGIDVVLHQVIPGYAHNVSAAIVSCGNTDPAFFHYVLAQLAASDAQLDPVKRGRAMCEIFGAYGWGEGTPMMKWLTDFMLVRGINVFVPHAFSPLFPDPDCPPHFGATDTQGVCQDPQFEGFGELMKYMNKAANLLGSGKYITDVAVLYHAENEWMSDPDYIPSQKVCVPLLDGHISYSIVSRDHVLSAKGGDALIINGVPFKALIVPYSSNIPDDLAEKLSKLRAEGVRIIFAGGLPDGIETGFETYCCEEVPSLLRESGVGSISVDDGFSLLRHCCIETTDSTIYMFFNESVTEVCRSTVHLPSNGRYVKADLLNGEYSENTTDNGKVGLSLEPYQSAIYIFSDDLPKFMLEKKFGEPTIIKAKYHIETADSTDLCSFTDYCDTDALFNITSPEHIPDFSGKIRYTADFEYSGSSTAQISLGRVGENAILRLNGKDFGMRICRPYTFNADNLVNGSNHIEITVSNTLANRIKDDFSSYLQLSPSGLLEDITISSEIL